MEIDTIIMTAPYLQGSPTFGQKCSETCRITVTDLPSFDTAGIATVRMPLLLPEPCPKEYG